MKATHILVVEDSLTQGEALRALLETEGATVTLATSAEAALAYLDAPSPGLPDIILSDVVMPGLSGYELLKRLKASTEWADIPALLLTSLSDPLDIVRGLECGADNYVTKPYEPEQLLARVRHALSHKPLRKGLRASLGVKVNFLGTSFMITSEREQILDLFLSSVEDVVRTNTALEESQQELAEAQRQLEAYALKMAERAHSSAEQLRTVIEASPVAIIVTDAEFVVTLWNPAAERMFGFVQDEALRQPLKIIPPDRREEFERVMNEVRAGRTVHHETQRLTRAGTLIEARVAVSSLSQNGHDGFVAIVEDVTEQKRTATALAASQQQLMQAQKMEAIGTLAGGIAHDFNNLLTVIRSYSSMLVEDLPVKATEHRQYASEIMGAADHASALTRQLLAFSRKQVVQPRLIDVHDVVLGIEKLLGRLISANINLQVTPASTDSLIMMDPGQLEQVLMNLVINASHAMPNGGRIDIATRSELLQEPRETLTGRLEAGAYLVLIVRDQGIGMDEATLGQLFEPFFTTKPAGVGTGLGTSIVKSIVVDYKGGIVVRSVVGTGTTFDVYLPLAHGVDAAPAVAVAEVPTGNEVIFVVDDDDAVRNAVRMSLERFGYTVLDMADGGQALQLSTMLNASPDLLVTDLMMPRVNGRELVEQLEREGRAPKILLMSGYPDDELMRRGLADARYPYIQKPFTREQLARKVREVLDTR